MARIEKNLAKADAHLIGVISWGSTSVIFSPSPAPNSNEIVTSPQSIGINLGFYFRYLRNGLPLSWKNAPTHFWAKI
jgi:uncharacterized Fe-S cluster-containing protein